MDSNEILESINAIVRSINLETKDEELSLTSAQKLTDKSGSRTKIINRPKIQQLKSRTPETNGIETISIPELIQVNQEDVAGALHVKLEKKQQNRPIKITYAQSTRSTR